MNKTFEIQGKTNTPFSIVDLTARYCTYRLIQILDYQVSALISSFLKTNTKVSDHFLLLDRV